MNTTDAPRTKGLEEDTMHHALGALHLEVNPAVAYGVRDAVMAYVRALTAERDALREALERIEGWSRAYPLDVFPEPDWGRVRELLKAGGITLDAVSASNMRHAVEGAGGIARRALKGANDHD